MGISNLILGSRGLPIRQKEGGINQEEVIKNLAAKEQQQQRSFSSFLTSNFQNVSNRMPGNRSHNGGNSIPMTSPPSNPAPAPPPPHHSTTPHNTNTLPPQHPHHYNHQHPPPSTGGWTPPASSATHVTSANSNPPCIHGRGQR